MPIDAPALVTSALDTWLAHHDRLAPGVIEGLYVVGSVALADWQPTSDVDIVGFTADPTDAAVVTQLEAAHDAYRSDESLPTVDGPVLAWADVTSPPIAAQRPWTLDGEFRFDGDCFEINPVIWFTLATYGVVVRGESASTLGVYLDRREREAWCRENLRTYWRGVRDQIVRVLVDDPDRTMFSAAMTEWCALGVARLAYTIESGDVASKSAAGEWARERHSDHADVLDRAVRIRRGVGAETVDRRTVDDVIAWMTVLVD